MQFIRKNIYSEKEYIGSNINKIFNNLPNLKE